MSAEIIELKTVHELVEEERLYEQWQNANAESERCWNRLIKVRDQALKLDKKQGTGYYLHG